VNGGRTCTRFSEPHGAADQDLVPATALLLAGEVLGPICSSEAKRSRGATAVRGSARITGKGEVSASGLTCGGGTEGGGKGTLRPPSSPLGSVGGNELGICGGGADGQWQMEGGGLEGWAAAMCMRSTGLLRGGTYPLQPL
jgi:hypothetical protein